MLTRDRKGCFNFSAHFDCIDPGEQKHCQKCQIIRKEVKDLAKHLYQEMPFCDELFKSMRHLEMALMYVKEGLAKNG